MCTSNRYQFRCHYLGDFASSSKEESQNPYYKTTKDIDKIKSELKTLKLGKSISEREAKLIELNAKLEEYKPFKDKIFLSSSAKKRLLKIARELKYGIVERMENKYTSKGLLNEEDSIRLWSKFSQKRFLRKNTKRFFDETKQGEPDLLNVFEHGKVVDDIKSSYNKETFDNKLILPKIYYWQDQGYMDLLKYDWGRIVFCLTNTPVEIILGEFRTLLWKHKPAGVSMDDFMLDESICKLKTQFFRNHTYSDDGYIPTETADGLKWKYNENGYWDYLVQTELLDESFEFIPVPDNERVKVFQFKRNQGDIDFINNRLKHAQIDLENLLQTREGIEIIELSKGTCSNNETID
ncbi:hypothetical protein ACMGDK_11220 [Chryseobacterium sp. DT-3]|uniref:hypothetical protein n=1 Tax=Chryseobacterium sp. DT-3 TaxID=3396164 RepID=UPI003F1BA78A